MAEKVTNKRERDNESILQQTLGKHWTCSPFITSRE